MKKIICCAFILSLFSYAVPSRAIDIPNPSPALFGSPITENGYFYPSSNVAVFKSFDFSKANAGPDYEFGFFYGAGSNMHLVPVFSGSGQRNGIYFDYGVVMNFDTNTPFSTFTYGNEPIGFYLNTGVGILYSDQNLNQGTDLFAAFPWLNGPSAPVVGAGNPLLLAFAYPMGDAVTTLELVFTDGIPANPVPEPGTLLLVGIGMFVGGIRFFLKRRQS